MAQNENKDRLDPEVIKEIQERLRRGENFWRLIDQYNLPIEKKLELIRLFGDDKWD